MAEAVIVTGAAGDIGRAMVELFLARGKAVIGWDIDTDGLADNERRFGNAYRSIELDITSAEAVARAYDQSLQDHADIAVLVNNAGGVTQPRLAETTEANWQRDIELNLSGAFRCIQAVRAGMARRGGGAIVNIASVNGAAMYGYPAYSAAKAGLIQLTKFAATEFGPQQIRVNAILPGTVRTRAWDDRLAADPAILDNVKHYYALRDICAPADVAELAWFLACGPSRMITGAAIPIDGGLLAGIGRVAGDFCGVEF